MDLDEGENDSKMCDYQAREEMTSCLQKALNSTIERYCTKIRFSMFQKRYKEIYVGNQDVLKDIYAELLNQLKETIKTDVNVLYEAEDLVSLIKSLDQIIKKQEIDQQQTDQLAWRPSTKPLEDLRDHIYPIKLKHKEALGKILEKLRSTNQGLTHTVNSNHAQILHIKKSNEEEESKFRAELQVLKTSEFSLLSTTLHNISEKC